MKQGIKNRDIRDFEKCANKLNEIMKRIREYNSEANLFANGEDLCLMCGDWHEKNNYDETIVCSVDIYGLDAGAF